MLPWVEVFSIGHLPCRVDAIVFCRKAQFPYPQFRTDAEVDAEQACSAAAVLNQPRRNTVCNGVTEQCDHLFLAWVVWSSRRSC